MIYFACASLFIGLLVSGAMLLELADEGPVPFSAIVLWSAFAVLWPALLVLGIVFGLVFILAMVMS